LVEEAVSELGGHKSLYSTVHYPADEFWQRYNGVAYAAVKGTYDPDGRLPDLYQKVSVAQPKE
jgi:FAD/FMN-containing dehydrogenase